MEIYRAERFNTYRIKTPKGDLYFDSMEGAEIAANRLNKLEYMSCNLIDSEFKMLFEIIVGTHELKMDDLLHIIE